MIEIRIKGRVIHLFVYWGIRIALGGMIALGLLWLAWGHAPTVAAQSPGPTFPEPPVGTRVALPVLSFVGNDATNQTLIQVQNVGSDFTRAIMLVWPESSGACGPQALGPFKVECSGIIKPGATWMFGERQVPAGAKSAILYTFPHEALVDDQLVNVGDEFCDRLFSEVTFDAEAFRRFDLAFRQGNDIFGLPTTGGQPVAVDVIRVGQGTPSFDLTVSGAYSGVTGPDQGVFDPVFGGFSYYAPVVYADAGGLTSWVYLQNAGLDCTGIELWFQEQGECLRAQICEIFTLAPGETNQYNVSNCVGPSFVGSLWIRTSQPTAVVVDHIGQNTLMTDRGVAAQNAIFDPGSEVLFGPLIYREFQGWETSITVQNLSGTQFGEVKVYFYDESGNIITTLVDYICPRGTQTFFLPVINGLPGHYVGAVRVESLTSFRHGGYVPITGVAHLKKYTDPTTSQTQEAISYNLFGESQSFDWQLGPGTAGLIGVPSVLKQGRGLSTELAIQNVNPNPGFTDFAIYIYDANGLLEVVCEKLHQYNVEYINFNAWGIVDPGFTGSVVISGVFTTQQGGFGLSAVAIQRVQSILQFNPPGDESSGHEAFPIFVENFDFEGTEAPACPGLSNACTVPLIVGVHQENGDLVGAGALVQLTAGDVGQGQALYTGTTDSTGTVRFTVAADRAYGVRVIYSGEREYAPVDLTNIGPFICGTKDNVVNVTRLAAGIKDAIFLYVDGVAERCGGVALAGVDADNDGQVDFPLISITDATGASVVSTTPDARGEFLFGDIQRPLRFYEGVYHVTLDVDGDGHTDQTLAVQQRGTLTTDVELIDADDDGDIDGDDLRLKHGIAQLNFVGLNCAQCNDENPVFGTVFVDRDGDGIADTGPANNEVIPGAIVSVIDGDFGSLGVVAFTDATGFFSFSAPVGTHVVKITADDPDTGQRLEKIFSIEVPCLTPRDLNAIDLRTGRFGAFAAQTATVILRLLCQALPVGADTYRVQALEEDGTVVDTDTTGAEGTVLLNVPVGTTNFRFIEADTNPTACSHDSEGLLIVEDVFLDIDLDEQ